MNREPSRKENGEPHRFSVLSGFTLLEVMIACAVFFMVAFAILELVTQGLVAAKAIQQREPDPGIILASLSLSNALEEGSISGDYEDLAPGMYPGHRWEAFIQEVGTNGLFEVNVLTFNQRKRSQNPTTISAQFWRPLSKPGSASRPGL
jgi:Tfp pilus assembly protein PilV